MKKFHPIQILSLAAGLILVGSWITDAFAQNQQEVSDEVLLQLYDGARLADVVDGLATVGYTGVGVMDPKISPLWRDVQEMTHRISGIAVTVRYGPTNRPMNPGVDLTDPDGSPFRLPGE